jgi:hypothetical protein
VVAQIEQEMLGAQDFSGGVCRTIRRATAALGAGVEIEDVLPGEMLDARVTDARGERVGLLAGFLTSAISASVLFASGAGVRAA